MIGVDKWNRGLGQLRSMALSLYGARGLFSQIQEALWHVKGKMFTLSKGVHEALAYFCWLAEDLSKRPTYIYKLVPLIPTVDGYHNTFVYMCGGIVFPGPTAIPQVLSPHPSTARPFPKPTTAHPVVWRVPFPKYVVDSLVIWTNPQGKSNNSGL